MVIKASSRGQIAALIADLESGDGITREAAIARLTVFGARAVDRLIPVLTSRTSTARIAALRALEAICDLRAVDPVLANTRSPEPDVGVAAIRAARPFLRTERGADIVDHLTSIALDGRANETVRVAAIHALQTLESTTIKPLVARLKKDASASVRAALEQSADAPREGADAVLTRASEELPDQADELATAIEAAGATVPVTTLLALIEAVRAREAQLPPARRAKWTSVRGRAHLVLAARRSRVALFELRESIEGARTPLPAEFVAALSRIGDRSCLEAIAAAYAHSLETPGARVDTWRSELADAFRAIVSREKLTRRHAVVKRIETRWGRGVQGLL